MENGKKTKLCPHCKSEIDEKAVLCVKCGKQLPNKKKGCFSGCLLSFVCVFAILIIIGIFAPDDTPTAPPENTKTESVDNSKKEDKKENKKEEKKKEKNQKIELPKKEPKTEFVKDDVKITYKSHKLAGNNIIVYYEMENNSRENKCFDYCFDVKGWQDGIELETNYIYDCDEEKNTNKEIKPGAKIEVATVFELSNGTSDVEIEFQPWISFIDEVLFELKLSIN